MRTWSTRNEFRKMYKLNMEPINLQVLRRFRKKLPRTIDRCSLKAAGKEKLDNCKGICRQTARSLVEGKGVWSSDRSLAS